MLLGRAGSGKTHTCLERLLAGRAGRCLMLVPTYSQAEHLRYALLDRTRGLSQRVIHTFTSLAERFGGCRLGELIPEARRDQLARTVLEPTFGDAAEQPGFRGEFLSAVKELKEQGRPLEEARDHARAHFPEGHRARLLFDAAVAYAERLAELGLDHEDLLLRTRAHFADEAPPLDLLLVDGFHDFTPVQRAIVDQLADGAAETVVSLPQGYETADQTAATFRGYAREELPGNRRSDGDLAALERGLFGEAKAEATSVSLLAAASEEDEADRLARHVATSERPLKDFLLVRRGFDGRHAHYRAAFARYGIPLRFFGSEPLATGPLARAVEVFLRSRFQSVDRTPLEQSPYWSEADDVDAPLDVQLARAFTLARVLEQTPDGDADMAHAARLLAAVKDEAATYDDRPAPDAARLVLRRLPQLRAPRPDRRHDCVYAVEAKEARQWEKPVVLVAGLDATAFPKPVRQDLFLRDDERRELADRGFALPLRERQQDEERYLFYICLTRARDEMLLSYAAYDEGGTEVAPSPFLDEVRAVLPDLPERHVALAEQFVPVHDAMRPADLLPIVADGLARVDREENGLANALHDRDAVDRALLAWPRRLELTRLRPLPDLAPDPAARLSASRIKNYRRCPFLLLQQMLHAERPREEALDGALRGQIVHDTLEKLTAGGDVDALFEETFEELAGALELGMQGRAWKRRMRDWVQHGVASMRDADVVQAELAFRQAVGDVTLRGRIDRLDRCAQGEIVRDYKTGEKVDAKDEPQLDVYLLARPDAVGAVFDLLRKGSQKGFVRDDVEGSFGKAVERLSGEELDGRRRELVRLVERIATSLRAGQLNVAPSDPETCTRTLCDGYDLCRVAKARWLARTSREVDA